MDFDWLERDWTVWLNLALRWFHIFAAILWIGQTWFFTWMDRQLGLAFDAAKAAGTTDKGVLWMVHSGGFYLVEKQTRPALMPQKLHWFKYEALFTWLSGFFLLVLVYYSGGLMVTEDLPLTNAQAIAAGLGLFVIAWFVYDLLWLSPLGKSLWVGGAICFVALIAIDYGLGMIMTGRAAFFHVGAMLGTLMVANVWVRIIPAQKAMVKALTSGQPVDLELGERAKMRSKHNTFMVMPVLMIMIANHFPSATYGVQYHWVVLGVLVLVGWVAAKIVRDH